MERRHVTRDELYRLVWAKPISRLAEEFGISGNGLAKICDRLNVPYPPRGYWAKKEAGKPVVTFKLPPLKQGTPDSADIYPTAPKPEPPPEIAERVTAVAAKVGDVIVPDDLEKLHPRVKAWLAEHRKAQKERAAEGSRYGRDSWYARTPLPDLTERDLYRFRASSALFIGLERAGIKLESTPLHGKCVFLSDGHQVECSIVEKLVKTLKPREEARSWTAYPDHHQSGLASSGFLRVSITTYLQGVKPQWVETETKKIGALLPDIVGAIVAAGPVLERMKRAWEERERQFREEQSRRYEEQRLKEIDDKRWTKFRECAAAYEERLKLLEFIAEIEARTGYTGADRIDDRSVADWLVWAKKRTQALDPFEKGAKGLFEQIARAGRW